MCVQSCRESLHIRDRGSRCRECACPNIPGVLSMFRHSWGSGEGGMRCVYRRMGANRRPSSDQSLKRETIKFKINLGEIFFTRQLQIKRPKSNQFLLQASNYINL